MCLLGQRKKSPRVRKQPLALFGRADALSVPMQQRAANALVQAPDLLAHGRPGAVDAFASAGKPTRIDEGDKAAEQIEVEH
jgi:hypothetical protein